MVSHLLSVPSPLNLQQYLSGGRSILSVTPPLFPTMAAVQWPPQKVPCRFSGFSLTIDVLYGSICPCVLDVCSMWVLIGSFWARSEPAGVPTGSDPLRLAHTFERHTQSALEYHSIPSLVGPPIKTMATSLEGYWSSIIYFPQFPPRTTGLVDTRHLCTSWEH